MRNPAIMRRAVDKIFKINFNQSLRESVQIMVPLDPSKLAIDIAIDEWGPKVSSMLPNLRARLKSDIA